MGYRALQNNCLRHYIDGDFVEAGSTSRFENLNPATGQTLFDVFEAERAQVDEAVAAARAALRGPWSRANERERATALQRIAQGIEARFDDFLKAECADTGKPYALARRLDIPRAAQNFRAFSEAGMHHAGESFSSVDPSQNTGIVNHVVRKPKGVIAVICPWNLPLLLTTWKVAPALACGNTVIVKPSEETPTTATLLAEVIEEAGIPKGVFNVVHGFGPESAGAFLTEHPDVDAITFTGETVTGEAIMKNAANGIRDVSFELGGKNPGIVFADCDIERAVEGIANAAFLNSGQICLGTERVYVEKPIFDAFTRRLVDRAKGLTAGEPADPKTNFGPIVSKQQQEKILGFYRMAQEKNATTHTGGSIPTLSGELKNGFWVEPTVWTGLAEDSPIIKNEIFGPCCHLAPFESEEEVIAMANDTDYGLCSTIWTENGGRANRLADAIECGVTWINCWFLRDLRTPFGGSKRSGIGREGGAYSLDFYSETRNVCAQYTL